MEEIKVKATRRQSGGSKKIGRNIKKCARYRAEGRREKNQALRHARNRKRAGKLEKLRPKRSGAH